MDTPRPDRARFAAKLRMLRDLNGHMTQEELAAASGVDVGLIRNYEQEKSLAKDGALARLADALNASPATFRACALDNVTLLSDDAQLRLVGQLLRQISGAYDLEPFVDGSVVGLRGNGGYIEFALVEWMGLVEADEADTHKALDRRIEPEDYRTVQDRMVATFAELQRFELGYDGAFNQVDFPAQPPTLRETLKSLRKAAGLTQGELAKTADVSLFSVRAYEQGKRVPTDNQREALAKAFNVPEEVLTDFGIQSPNDAFHYLLELAYIYGVRPQRHDGIVLLAHASRKKSLSKLIRDWCFEWVEMQKTSDEGARHSHSDFGKRKG